MLCGCAEEPSYILHPSNTYSPPDDEAALEQLMNITLGPSHKGRAARWVPYRHSNGLAIYQHQGQGNGKDNEYMVSGRWCMHGSHMCSCW